MQRYLGTGAHPYNLISILLSILNNNDPGDTGPGDAIGSVKIGQHAFQTRVSNYDACSAQYPLAQRLFGKYFIHQQGQRSQPCAGRQQTPWIYRDNDSGEIVVLHVDDEKGSIYLFEGNLPAAGYLRLP
jgi:hypothetical protein